MDGQTWEYKAFISYRHREFDRKVAIQLQKLLETYHIPRRLGKKENWKIFRDETELPASSDLSEDIRHALERSEFLIVICSTATKESRWCRQEIAHFKSLHQHTTKKICTLLIEGDPDSVFPEELCWSEMEKKETDGQLHRISVEVEPLAANIVAESEAASLKKLRAEFLRIAAPMLGVTYDTLKQRQRTYRYQRITAAAVGAAVIAVLFSGYALRQKSVIAGQAAQITEEFARNLISQSEYYVKEANELLKNNDIPGAVERLLAALPDEQTERPIVADAVCSLTSALGLYTSDKDVSQTAMPVKRLELQNKQVKDFLLSKDGAYVVVSDGEKTEVRQTDTFETVCTIRMSSGNTYMAKTALSDFVFLKEDHSLLYVTKEKVGCVDYLTGRELWSNTGIISQDTVTVKARLSENEKTLVLIMPEQIVALDADTGKKTAEMTYDFVQNDEIRDAMNPDSVQEASLSEATAVSADGRYAVFVSGQWAQKNEYYQWVQRVYVADLQEKRTEALEQEFPYIETVTIADDGHVYVMTDTSQYDSYYAMETTYTGENRIWAFSLPDLKLCWDTPLENGGNSVLSRIETAKSPYASVKGQIILAEYGNRITTLASDTGEIVENIQYETPITGVGLGDKTIRVSQENGKIASHSYTQNREPEQNKTVLLSLFTDKLVKTVGVDGVYYVLCKGNGTYCLLRYELEKSDERYRCVLKKDTGDTYEAYTSAGHGWQYKLTQDMLYLVDCGEGAQYEIALPEECEYLGMSADETVFWLAEKYGYGKAPAVYAVYPTKQKAEKKEIPLQVGEAFVDLTVSDHTVYYLVKEAEKKENTKNSAPEEKGKSGKKEGDEVSVYDTMQLYGWTPENGECMSQGGVSLKETRNSVAGAAKEYMYGSLVADTRGQTVAWLLSQKTATSEESGEGQLQAVQIDTADGTVQTVEPDIGQLREVTSVKSHILQPSGTAEGILYTKTADTTGQTCFKIWKKDGSEIQFPEKTGQEVTDAFFSEMQELLFVLYTDTESGNQLLTAYDLQTGTETAEVSLKLPGFGTVRTEQIGTTAFVLYNERYAGNGYVIDEAYLDTGGILACIPSCVGTDGTDLFVYHEDISSETKEWGSFPYMSVDELIKKGEAFLK